jgi:regulator of protease activity HflC (stomatin/prohibitin superfamily)
MIVVGIAVLDANDMAIDYNHNTESVDTGFLWEQGTHFIGLGHSFITFSRTVIDLDMQKDPIQARTKDGLVVTMETRILYRITQTAEACSTLYLTFGEDWRDFFYYTSRATIQDVASEYDAFDFWSIRDEIDSEISLRLEPVFLDMFAAIDSFTLANFELPTSFQDALTLTTSAEQEYDAVAFDKETAITLRDTAVQAADQDVKAILNSAYADAESYLLSIEATIQNMEWAAQAEIEAYQSIKDTLGFSNDQLINFLWLDTVNYWARDSQQTYSLKTPQTLLA